MQVAADRSLPERPLTGLLEHPNEHHLAVKIDQALAARARSTVAGLGVGLPVGGFCCLRHQPSSAQRSPTATGPQAPAMTTPLEAYVPSPGGVAHRAPDRALESARSR